MADDDVPVIVTWKERDASHGVVSIQHVTWCPNRALAHETARDLKQHYTLSPPSPGAWDIDVDVPGGIPSGKADAIAHIQGLRDRLAQRSPPVELEEPEEF